MADQTYVTIQTERGEVQVLAELVWGNSQQSAKDKAAEHLASGSTLPAGSTVSEKAPKVIITNNG